jgi:hypothetical protein
LLVLKISIGVFQIPINTSLAFLKRIANINLKLKTLYEYTGETNPTRPIGEFPKLEVI